MSSSVESPIADTTTTTWSPALRLATIRCATRLIPSASATDDPPYFCTTSATAAPHLPKVVDGTLILSTERRRCSPSSRACALLGDIQAGVRDHGVQRAQRGPAVGAP